MRPRTIVDQIEVWCGKIVLPIALAGVGNLLVGVAERRGQVFGNRRSDTQRDAFFAVVVVVAAGRYALEQVEAGGEALAEEVRLGEGKSVYWPRPRKFFSSTEASSSGPPLAPTA